MADGHPSLHFLPARVLLGRTNLAVTVESVILEFALPFVELLQSGNVPKLQFRVCGNILLSTEDHHVTDEGAAYHRIAAVVDVRGFDPDTAGATEVVRNEGGGVAY